MKFNYKTKETRVTTNLAGGHAYILPAQWELYTLVATAGLSDQFYEKADAKLDRLRDLIKVNDNDFIARLAIYAREKMHLRSIPLVMAVELAKEHRGDGLVGKLVTRVIQRADEITELLAYYEIANERKDRKKLNRLSKQVQRGLADAFNKFDEYQFAKYNKATQVKLKDALFLAHPKAKDEAQQVLFDKIVKDDLQTPYTWEVEVSAVGQRIFGSERNKENAVREKWEELIFSNKMGYMASLRNLRNMLEADLSKPALAKLCAYIADKTAVEKSRQLPFRFLAAYREIKEVKSGKVSKVLDALEKAALHSAANISGFDDSTRVVIAADVSGSMQIPVSPKSKTQLYDIGLMLAMLLQSRCDNVITGMFGDTWKVINVPKKNILANVEEFRRREGEVGYSTNGHLVIHDLIQIRKVVDKVMIFTDCQLWNSNGTDTTIAALWKKYKAIAPGAKLYLFDLAGHGNAPLNILDQDVCLIAGWSDKIFDVLRTIEEGGDAMNAIRRISL